MSSVAADGLLSRQSRNRIYPECWGILRKRV
jgi:hypothetical protein